MSFWSGETPTLLNTANSMLSAHDIKATAVICAQIIFFTFITYMAPLTKYALRVSMHTTGTFLRHHTAPFNFNPFALKCQSTAHETRDKIASDMEKCTGTVVQV